MKLFRFALLILVQLSPIFVHINGEAVPEYKCQEEHTEEITVSTVGVAKLSKGCVLSGNGITFDIKAMYEAASKTPKNPVVIDISGAHFINSFIGLMNAKDIPDLSTRGPLLFTMDKAVLTGLTALDIGGGGQLFKIPPHSRITIINSEMTKAVTGGSVNILVFDSLELVTNCSVEISNNVINIKSEGGNSMSVLQLTGSRMKISDRSSFTLRNNNISMESHTTKRQGQYVWWQSASSVLTISETSTFTLVSNIISMVGHKIQFLRQKVWYEDMNAALTISKTSIYTWDSNTISITGYEVTDHLDQYMWFESGGSPLTISENSKYTWFNNIITMNGYKSKDIYQSVLYTLSPVMISALSHFILDYNKMLLSSKDSTTAVVSNVMAFGDDVTNDISGGSSMTWRNNCIGMGHKETSERHVFGGKWIIAEGSELLLDGNHITTTDKYENSGKLTELVWGPTGETDISDSTKGTLTIRNTKVYINSAGSATGSMMWSSSPFTSEKSVKQPAMEWSSATAKDSGGSIIPTWTYDNLKQQICPPKIIPNPGDGSSKPITITTKGESATAISSTIPAVLITSVVFLYLYKY